MAQQPGGEEVTLASARGGRLTRRPGRVAAFPPSAVVCALLALTPASGGCAVAGQDAPGRSATSSSPVNTSDVSTRSADDEVAAALPLKEEVARGLLRDAGPQARRLASAHFVVAFTSDQQKAVDLIARLEYVYAAHLRLARELQLTVRRPMAKLAVLFFGRYEEFKPHLAAANAPSDSFGVYLPASNRALFFDLDTHPDLDRIRAAIEQAAPAERDKLRQRLHRRQAWLAQSIIQHEAAHQLQVNLGLIPASNQVPVWLAEGLATLFEVLPPPSGQPGDAVNASRLFEYRKLYGDSPPTAAQMQRFLTDDDAWTGSASYPLAWAVTSYLRDERRSALAALLRKMAIDGGLPAATTERQAVVDELLGPIDDRWLARFSAYLSGLSLDASAFGD